MSAWSITAAVVAVLGVFAVAFYLGFTAGGRLASTLLGRLHAAAAIKTGDTAAYERIMAAAEEPAVRREALRRPW